TAQNETMIAVKDSESESGDSETEMLNQKRRVAGDGIRGDWSEQSHT
ncbi:hypothetical protein A2U01_0108204, partial [Trifolium medium]|nr:hypothetical protein [Trifolium medium]